MKLIVADELSAWFVIVFIAIGLVKTIMFSFDLIKRYW